MTKHKANKGGDNLKCINTYLKLILFKANQSAAKITRDLTINFRFPTNKK